MWEILSYDALWVFLKALKSSALSLTFAVLGETGKEERGPWLPWRIRILIVTEPVTTDIMLLFVQKNCPEIRNAETLKSILYSFL